MTIKVSTKYNLDTLQKLYNIKKKKGLIIYIIFALVIMLLGGILLIIDLKGYLGAAIVLLAFGASYVPLQMLKDKMRFNALIKDPNVSDKHLLVYTIDEETLTLDSERQGAAPAHDSVPLTRITSALEDAECFYLFLGNSNAEILPKNCFTEGTPDNLRTILSTKLGKKFAISIKD